MLRFQGAVLVLPNLGPLQPLTCKVSSALRLHDQLST